MQVLPETILGFQQQIESLRDELTMQQQNMVTRRKRIIDIMNTCPFTTNDEGDNLYVTVDIDKWRKITELLT